MKKRNLIHQINQAFTKIQEEIWFQNENDQYYNIQKKK